jgi:hypothetical protein
MGQHVLDVLDRIDEVLDDHAAGVFAEAMDSVRDLIDGSVPPGYTKPFEDCDCPACDWSAEPTTAAMWTAGPGDSDVSARPDPPTGADQTVRSLNPVLAPSPGEAASHPFGLAV